MIRPRHASIILVAMATAAGCRGTAKPVEKPLTHSPPGDPLTDRGLVFEQPPGYDLITVPSSDRWHHERAVKSRSFALEVRYGVAPAPVDEQARQACGGADCPAPSGLAVGGILRTAVADLAKPGELRVKEFPLDAVREEFHAHWGGVVGFEVAPGAAPYKQAIAVVIHRVGRGTAMFVALYDAVSPELEDEWMRAFHSLRFAEPFPIAGADHASSLAGTRWRCEDFLRLRFERSTYTTIQISAAMAAMGSIEPYETAYHEITYLPGSQFAVRPFRVDNMEMGDRTPKQPVERRFTYQRTDDKLVIDVDATTRWECTLVRPRSR